jgi:hypothetical protein
MSQAIRRFRVSLIYVSLIVGWAIVASSPAETQSACTQTLSAGANVASAVSAAAAGSTICLNTGNYGTQTFSGISKSPRVTIRSVSGQGGSLNVKIQSGTNGLTFNSVTFTGVNTVTGSTVHDLTFQNSSFNSAFLQLYNLSNSNILLDKNTHNNVEAGGQVTNCCRIIVADGSGNSGVTVQNSVMNGGSSDGIQVGQPMNILNNEFANILETCSNGCHTDAIQIYGGTSVVIRGNYIHNTSTGIVAFDGTSNDTVENNIIDTQGRPWGIEWYADHNSIIRHNTVLYRASCDFNLTCGTIDINTKGASGSGTQVYDNIATTVRIASGVSVARQDHNLLRSGAKSGDTTGSPTYVGGSLPTTIAGFELASGSLGNNGASDGTDIGMTLFGTTPTPTPRAPTNVRIAP